MDIQEPIRSQQNLEELVKLLREQNQGLAGRVDALEGEVKELEASLKEAVESAVELSEIPNAPDRELVELTPGSTCSVFDGLTIGEFSYHEQISFKYDMGYDETVLATRAMDTVYRALGKDSNGRCGENCCNLPSFSQDRVLEIYIRVL